MDSVESAIVGNQPSLPPNEFVVLPGKAFTASEIIKTILLQSKDSIKIVDNYMSENSVQVIENANRERNIYIITKDIDQKFINAVQTTKKGWGGAYEVKESNAFHDRYLILDDTDVWVCGPSLDYIGVKKPGVILKIEEPEISKIIINLFDDEWKKSKSVT